jgi:Minichromosome loss protein, Mcl1, middle region
VWDTATRSQTCSGMLPLSPRATLTWLAFSEQGTLCAMDSEGCAHVIALTNAGMHGC